MIVVVGGLAASGTPSVPAGLAASVATGAARRGGRVELVSRIGDDPDGDAVLLALARAGVGHVAVLRDAGRATPRVIVEAGDAVDPGSDPDDPAGAGSRAVDAVPLAAADLELGLRYLTDFGVLVVAEPLDADALAVAVDAAAFASAHLVLIVDDPDSVSAPPDASTVLQAPPDAGASFAELVAAYAVALDGGAAPRDAFADAIRATGSESAADT